MFKNLNYRTVGDWWTAIQVKIGTCIAHIAFFCFQIALVTAFEIRLATRQFPRLFPKGNLYFLKCASTNNFWGEIVLTTFVLIFG